MADLSERLRAALQGTPARVALGAVAVAAVLLILVVVVKPIVLPDASGTARPTASTSAAGPSGSAAASPGNATASTDPSPDPTDASSATDAAGEGASDSPGPAATAPSAARLLAQLRSFIAANDALYRASDTARLFATLNPIVIDTYGAARCRRAITAYATKDFKTTIRKATGPDDWTFEAPDGTKTVLHDVYTVDITRVRNKDSSRATIHLAWSPIALTWFSGC